MRRSSDHGFAPGAASAAVGVASLLFVGTPARAEMDHVTVALPSPIVDFAAEYIAEELFYKDQEVEVKSLAIAGVGAMNAVISGSVEFSFSSGGSLTRAAARGQRLLAIATLNNRVGEFAVIRKDIADAAHFDPAAPIAVRAQILKGHTFGIGGMGSIGDAYLKVVAKAGGIDFKDIVFSALQPPDIIAAMNRKVLDGFSLGSPWAQQVVHDGSAVVIASGVEGDPPGYAPAASALLVTRPQLCAEHRSICVKVGHAMALAADFIHAHPQEAIAILKKKFVTVDDAVLVSAFSEVVKMTAQPPVTDAAQLKNGDKLNLDAGFIKPEEVLSSYDGLFTSEFAK
jgi:ABC-type nitrate/sulfonate/bicarbonate transport system substrate-binding protein